MADGKRALEQQLARLRRLPELVRRAAPLAAVAVSDALKDGIRRGESPTGQSWKPRADGGAPLPNAARDLRVVAEGTTVVATLDGVHARHDKGAVRGGVRRQILPASGLPAPMARAIDQVLVDEFDATMRGGAA